MPKNGRDIAITSVPTRLFLVVTAVICLALAGSAGYTFYTLRALHGQYLDRVGHDIAEAIEVQVRGPLRADPAVWRPIFEQALLSYEGQLLFIELIDARGTVLARADSGVDESAAHLVRAELRGPGWGRRASARRPVAGGQHIRMGIDPDVGSFMVRQGYLHLGVAALAIAALVGLTFHLMGTLSRYLELKKEEEAARNLAALGRLSATLAHEIRNPLGAIKGLTQVVQEELDDRHQARPLTDTVVREAERLEKLVSDLLIFARPRQPKISAVDLPALLAETAEILGERFRQAKVSLHVETDGAPMRIQSDPDGLRQVVLNLLLNALEATPGGGNVRMGFGRTLAGHLSIWVEDGGTGLGDSDPENLFEPFVTTKLKGSGLGLAVSRQIVQSLGGELKLENRAEGGARSTVLLPVAE